MKKLLLLCLTFSCNFLFAQQTLFDFTNPSSLITEDGMSISAPTGGGSINITNKKIVKDGIIISFDKGTGYSGVQIKTGNEGLVLAVGSQAIVTFEATGGKTLTSINPVAELVGDWHKVAGEPGIIPVGDVYKRWNNNGELVTKVSFSVTYTEARFKQFVVSSTPALKTLKSIPDTVDSIEIIDKIQIVYDAAVGEKTGHADITLIGRNDTISLNPSIKKDTVTFVLNKSIQTDGDYTLNIPEGTFYSLSSGAVNQEESYTYKVRTIYNSFIYDFVTPADSAELSFPISLVFPEVVGKVLTYGFRIYKSGNRDSSVAILKASISEDDRRVVILDNVNDAEFDPGDYQLVIDEKCIYNNKLVDGELDPKDGRYNPEIIINYVVNEVVDTLQLMRNKATQLLSVIGIGYPAEDCQERSDLADLLEKEEATIQDYEAAIGAFCKAEVVLPEPKEGKGFKICGVNAKGERAWLCYIHGSVVLNKSAAQATTFRLEKEDDSFIFKTRDEHYLHVLSTISNSHISTANVTKVNDGYTQLTISKLVVANADSTETIGKLSIKGLVDVNVQPDNTVDFVYSTAAVDYSSPLSIVETPTQDLYFDDVLSSGFIFIEVDVQDGVIPDNELDRISIGCELTGTGTFQSEEFGEIPSIDTINDLLTLSFSPDIMSVEFYPEAAYIANVGGERINTAVLFAVEDTTSYLLDASALSEGDFSFVIPEGTLTCEIDGYEEKKTNNEVRLSFHVGKISEPSTADLERKTINAKLTSTIESSADPLTLTFIEVKSVVFTKSAASYITDKDKKELRKAAISGQGTTFILNVLGLPAGNYYLVIPEGTLTCRLDDLEVTNELLELPFTITTTSTEPSDNSEFLETDIHYSRLPYLNRIDAFPTSVLNEVHFFMEFENLYIDESKVVELKRDLSAVSDAPIASGHFVADELQNELLPNFQYNAYKLVFDVKELPESLRKDAYKLIIPAGTMGLETFGKYLGLVSLEEGESRPKKSDCLVNRKEEILFNIDDDASGIYTLNHEMNSIATTFDLQGRKVTTPTKPGVYVVNGKKRVVK